MIVSGDADRNCNPLHARKMTARLQAANVSEHPIFLDYSKFRGHSPVLPLGERIEALTDRMAFLVTSCSCQCEREVIVMSFLILKAYLKLIHFDLYLTRGNFAALYEKVRNYPVGKRASGPDTVDRICSAIDMACIWYWKEALCLQRSAATACLLKKCGVPAQMVIGAQQMPFKAHAWVEVDGPRGQRQALYA